jgi:hypothetical protein
MTKTKPTKAMKQVKSDKQQFSKLTIIYALFFLLFVILFGTLIMPRSAIIGVFLQLFAGLIFLLYQLRERILQSNLVGQLIKALDSPAFHSRLSLLAIPFIIPLFLVLYFRFTSTDIPWFSALFSIAFATAFSCVIYFFAVVNTARWIQRLVTWIRQKRRKVVGEISPNYLITNLVLLVLSAIFGVLILLEVPIQALLSGSSIITIASFSLIMAGLAFFGCILLLSLLYFSLIGLLKAGTALKKRMSLNLSDADRASAMHAFWALLLASWLWGGILLIINMW